MRRKATRQTWTIDKTRAWKRADNTFLVQSQANTPRPGKRMPFHTRKSVHTIDVAPTGRARCRKCKGIVEKGSVRIASTVFVCPGRYTVLVRHGECVDAGFARGVLSVYGSARRLLAGMGVGDVDAERVRMRIEEQAGGAKK